MTKRPLILSALVFALVGGVSVSSGHAQRDTMERILEMHGEGPNTFFLTNRDRSDVVSFNKERVVEICLGEDGHGADLQITFDGHEAMLYAGNCLLLEAKKVSIQAAGNIEAGFALRGRVRTIS